MEELIELLNQLCSALEAEGMNEAAEFAAVWLELRLNEKGMSLYSELAPEGLLECPACHQKGVMRTVPATTEQEMETAEKADSVALMCPNCSQVFRFSKAVAETQLDLDKLRGIYVEHSITAKEQQVTCDCLVCDRGRNEAWPTE